MSALVKCSSKMKNKDQIVTALKMMGVPAESILSSDSGMELRGYQSQKATVEVLVRKAFHGGYGDFGFSRGDNGTYEILVDDMDDVGSLARKLEVNKFSSSVNQWYSAAVAQRELKKKGLYTKIKKDGNKLLVVATG